MKIKIGEYLSVYTGKTPSKKDDSFYIGGKIGFVKPPQLQNGLVSETMEYINELGSTKTTILPKGSVLITCIGNLGRCGILTEPMGFNQQINAVSPSIYILPKFIFYYFQSSDFISQMHEVASATTVTIVNKGKFESLYFPIYPLPTQQRIVSEIEKQFARIDAGIQALQIIEKKLKEYKASLLKAAVEGKLTTQRRKNNPDTQPASELLEQILTARRAKREADKIEEFKTKGKRPQKNEKWKEKYIYESEEFDIYISNLPITWIQCLLGDIIFEGPQNGLYKPASSYGGEGVTMLRIDDYQNGRIKEKEDMRVLSEITEKEKYIYSLDIDDLVINRVNSMTHIGKSTIITNNILPAVFESNMMRIKLTKRIHNKYIELFLHSYIGTKELKKSAKNAVNQASINQGDVKSVIINLPPLAEQKKIVEIIESKLSLTDNILSTSQNLLIQAKHLKQSLLQKAYTGELVPQLPEDGDVEELLEQIKQAKADYEAKVKAKKKTKRTKK